jgi:DNA polymerase III sliding clamp (beta) subunit (PCNA family)
VKFDPMKNPAACAAKDATRYAVNGVGVVKDRHGKSWLASTDGRALLLVAVDVGEGDTDNPDVAWPVEVFDRARKATARGSLAVLALNGKARLPDPEAPEFPPLAQRFPSLDGVVPEGKPEHVMTFNAAYLATIQKALGADAVRIETHGDDMPARIVPVYLAGAEKARTGSKAKQGPVDDGSHGVLMPISGGDK